MKGVQQTLFNINEGRKGRNVGISTGIPKLDSVIYGVQKKTLLTVFADTSGGKTSMVFDIFVYNFIKNNQDRVKYAYLIYSFEMSEDILYTKLLSRHIYDTFGKVITYEDILSLTKPLSDSDYYYVQQAMVWLKEVSKNITILDKPLPPNAIYASCKSWLERYGKFEKLDEHRENYTPDDPNMYKFVICDHMGLISGSDSKKTKMDTVSDYFIYFRNKCNITGIMVQQANRNQKSMDRKLNNYEMLQLDDLKDTSSTSDASEIVIGLYYPYREKIPRCEGYPIQNTLKKRFRMCQILKNRFGQADVSIGLNFFGEIGLFKELPKPDEVSDWSKYLDLDVKKDIIEIKEETKDLNPFNFKL